MRIRTCGGAWTVVAALVVALGASPARAQSYDGSGVVRFGVFGQGTFVGLDVRESDTAVLPPVEDFGSGSISALGFGLSIGYDRRMHGNWIWGVEADWVYVGESTIYDGNRYTADWTASLRGRLGYYAHPGWLIYGTTGVGLLGLEHDAPAVRDTATTRWGWLIGAGTEVNWHHVILFGEYLYSDFERWDYQVGTQSYSVDADAHMLRFGIKFKVGHDYHDDVRYPRR